MPSAIKSFLEACGAAAEINAATRERHLASQVSVGDALAEISKIRQRLSSTRLRTKIDSPEYDALTQRISDLDEAYTNVFALGRS